MCRPRSEVRTFSAITLRQAKTAAVLGPLHAYLPIPACCNSAAVDRSRQFDLSPRQRCGDCAGKDRLVIDPVPANSVLHLLGSELSLDGGGTAAAVPTCLRQAV